MFRGNFRSIAENIYVEKHSLEIPRMCVGTGGRKLLPELVDIVVRYARPVTWEDVSAFAYF